MNLLDKRAEFSNGLYTSNTVRLLIQDAEVKMLHKSIDDLITVVAYYLRRDLKHGEKWIKKFLNDVDNYFIDVEKNKISFETMKNVLMDEIKLKIN